MTIFFFPMRCCWSLLSPPLVERSTADRRHVVGCTNMTCLALLCALLRPLSPLVLGCWFALGHRSCSHVSTCERGPLSLSLSLSPGPEADVMFTFIRDPSGRRRPSSWSEDFTKNSPTQYWPSPKSTKPQSQCPQMMLLLMMMMIAGLHRASNAVLYWFRYWDPIRALSMFRYFRFVSYM